MEDFDYPKHGFPPGGVLIASIDKHCYIYANRCLSLIIKPNSLVEIENVKNVLKLHPAIREAQNGTCDNIEIHHIADLPARSGLGSVHHYAVGLFNVWD